MKYSRKRPYQFHPAALIVPPSTNYARIKESISEHGIFHPIVMHNNRIVDGRARYTACVELGMVNKLRYVQMNTKKWKCPSLCALNMNLAERDFGDEQSYLMYTEFEERLKAEVEPCDRDGILEEIRAKLDLRHPNDDPLNSDWCCAIDFHNFRKILPHLSDNERECVRHGESLFRIYEDNTRLHVIANELIECPF